MDSQASLLAFLILTNLSLFATGSFTKCLGRGRYITNSTYSVNLNKLLSSLPSSMGDSGFYHYHSSQGRGNDRVFTVALCRPDIQLDSCRSCVGNATKDLVNSCQNTKQAILWDITCMLRYSDVYFLRNLTQDPVIVVKNPHNSTSPHQFTDTVEKMLGNLVSEAASGGSMMKVAVGDTRAPTSVTIFALLQCTPDLTLKQCRSCLMTLSQKIYQCCDGSLGARILVPSCILNYETFSFYNISRIHEVRAMSSSPPAPSPPVPSLPRSPEQLLPSTKGDGHNTIKVIIAVSSILCLLVVACFIWLSRRKKKRLEKAHASHNEVKAVKSLQYDFNKIREATDDFSDANKLGEGGFGVVYKGKLKNGQEIAVKRLLRISPQGDVEFLNEIMLLAKLQHRNLVQLLGFALEGTEKVLIYEYVVNGTLDHLIFDTDDTNAHYTDWDRRFKIIRGIVRGLLYLHEDSRLRIIHRDLKASNILLDATMNPKIADFGTAKLCESNANEINTRRIIGTYGYMPPEYVLHGRFSIKTDVFSFGVLALEIVSGQKNGNFQNEGITVEECLLNFAWRNWCEGTIINLIDPILRSASSHLREMTRCVHIALLCVQERASDRPTMASINLMLGSFTATLPTP